MLLVTSPLVIVICGYPIAATTKICTRRGVCANEHEAIGTDSLPSRDDIMEDLDARGSGSIRHNLLDTY